MNEELFNEASKSNILSKQLVDQLQESMTYSSISFINWTIEVLKLLKARIERGDKIKDETTGVIYDLYTFRQFVETNFSTYITGQVFNTSIRSQKIYFTLEACPGGYNLLMADSGNEKTYRWISSLSKRSPSGQLAGSRSRCISSFAKEKNPSCIPSRSTCQSCCPDTASWTRLR